MSYQDIDCGENRRPRRWAAVGIGLEWRVTASPVKQDTLCSGSRIAASRRAVHTLTAAAVYIHPPCLGVSSMAVTRTYGGVGSHFTEEDETGRWPSARRSDLSLTVSRPHVKKAVFLSMGCSHRHLAGIREA